MRSSPPAPPLAWQFSAHAGWIAGSGSRTGTRCHRHHRRPRHRVSARRNHCRRRHPPIYEVPRRARWSRGRPRRWFDDAATGTTGTTDTVVLLATATAPPMNSRSSSRRVRGSRRQCRRPGIRTLLRHFLSAGGEMSSPPPPALRVLPPPPPVMNLPRRITVVHEVHALGSLALLPVVRGWRGIGRCWHRRRYSSPRVAPFRKPAASGDDVIVQRESAVHLEGDHAPDDPVPDGGDDGSGGLVVRCAEVEEGDEAGRCSWG